MIAKPTAARFESLISKHAQIYDTLLSATQGNALAFLPISLPQPDFSIPIHAFFTSVSWLYVLYNESGKITVDFLRERCEALGLDPEHLISKHLNLTNCLRTCLQHNVNTARIDGASKFHICQEYIDDCLGTKQEIFRWPDTPENWNTVLSRFLGDAESVFASFSTGVGMVLADQESRDRSLQVLIARFDKRHFPYEYDDVVESACRDLGIDYVDVTIVRNKYYSTWNTKITLMNTNQDFKYQARMLVENTLVREEQLPPPITGADIINHLQVSPGKDVRRLLNEAYKIYNENPCDKEALLTSLREKVNVQKT